MNQLLIQRRLVNDADQQQLTSMTAWRGAQYLGLLASMVLIVALLYWPSVGLVVMWNVLIPLVPALLVVAPGLWRNICPMATFSLLPRRLGLSRRGIMSRHLAGQLSLAGLIGLFVIVPLRHPALNSNGTLTVLMLLAAVLVAFSMGVAYEWRSGWCNSLCPIHQVEKLYGAAPALMFSNAQCDGCRHCTGPCPDSARAMNPSFAGATTIGKLTGHLLTGSFVGFIWGWYRLPDFYGAVSREAMVSAYSWAWGCALVSLAVYLALYRWVCRSRRDHLVLVKVFATAAVCTYYWYRIPALTGFGPNSGSGMLFDLTNIYPDLPLISHIVTSTFFVWFLLLRKETGNSWSKRPFPVMNIKPVAEGAEHG